jgi:hypothetical protein
MATWSPLYSSPRAQPHRNSRAATRRVMISRNAEQFIVAAAVTSGNLHGRLSDSPPDAVNMAKPWRALGVLTVADHARLTGMVANRLPWKSRIFGRLLGIRTYQTFDAVRGSRCQGNVMRPDNELTDAALSVVPTETTPDRQSTGTKPKSAAIEDSANGMRPPNG